MNAGEIAALIGAAAAFTTALAALNNSRNSKEVADKLRTEITRLTDENVKLIEHNQYQDAILVDRELKIVELTRKITQWHTWSLDVGRMVNQMQLQIGYLTQQHQFSSPGVTRPLPTFPEHENQLPESD